MSENVSGSNSSTPVGARALVPRQATPAPWGGIQTLDEAVRIANMAAQSGLFGVQNAAEAAMKILAGHELGFGPVASLTDIHVIEGKTMVGAHLKACRIKASGKYDYRLTRCDDQECSGHFLERRGGKWEVVGTISVTIEQARNKGWTVSRKGKQMTNWESSPDDMLFARWISKGYKRYTPDLTAGIASYDPDEVNDLDEVRPFIQPPQVELLPAADQSPAAISSAPPVKLDGALDPEQIARVEGLLAECGVTAEQWRAKLATFGKNSVQRLTQAEIDEVE